MKARCQAPVNGRGAHAHASLVQGLDTLRGIEPHVGYGVARHLHHQRYEVLVQELSPGHLGQSATAEHGRDPVEVVLMVHQCLQVRHHMCLGPLHAEDLGKAPEHAGGGVPDCEDGVHKPMHEQWAQLLGEICLSRVLREGRHALYDGQAHSPHPVLTQLLDGREQGLRQDVDVDHIGHVAHGANQLQPHFRIFVPDELEEDVAEVVYCQLRSKDGGQAQDGPSKRGAHVLGMLPRHRQPLHGEHQGIQEVLGGVEGRDISDPSSSDGSHLHLLVRELLQEERDDRSLHSGLEDVAQLLHILGHDIPDAPRLVLRTGLHNGQDLRLPLGSALELSQRNAIADCEDSHRVLLVLRKLFEDLDELVEHALVCQDLRNAAQDVGSLAPHHGGVVATKPEVCLEQVVLLG
mmetsp:Transcript_86326/g.185032  ORF Transcript_86326/g.185032 Transcript_86326/m.185032 type:complete len:406 (+) Transcript_86326:40-1257(+)